MKVKLSQITIDVSKIKQLHNNQKRLQAGTKTIRPHYCIEFIDDTFITIDKREYKLLKGILENEKTKM